MKQGIQTKEAPVPRGLLCCEGSMHLFASASPRLFGFAQGAYLPHLI
jgi:hypothetical protein